MTSDRRDFLTATGGAFAALATSGCMQQTGLNNQGRLTRAAAPPLGPLVSDSAGLLDLPAGFSYRVLSSLGDVMDDGFTVPDNADGMGCFDLGDGKIALVRNHELLPQQDNGGVMGPAYDTAARSLIPLPGGTTTMVLDAQTLTMERQFRSLAGTIRNCAGGETPWGSWLSCEEYTGRANGQINRDHGYVFEVPAAANGLVDPLPLTAMGRFNHEAACVDPASGIVYMTEDRGDSLLYRFIPAYPGELARGGTLQALVLDGVSDTRNWESRSMAVGDWAQGRWITMDDVESPDDDLRLRGAAQGASLFARGEGLWMGDGELYFTCTNGGAIQQGQIFCLRPALHGADMLQLFFESSSPEQFSFGDNLTIAPNGHLIVCEDQYSATVDNYLRGITPQGQAYAFARLRWQTEPAGGCFSPDGRTLFVNVFSPTRTLAITGPWPWMRS